MKKKYMAMVVTGGLFLAACAPWKQIVKSEQPLDSFTSIKFDGFDHSAAYAKLPADDTKVKADIAALETQAGADLTKWSSERKAGDNGKSLSLKINLLEYKPSGAFSNGRIVWDAVFSEGGKVVAQGELTEKYQGGSKKLIFYTVYTMTKRYVALN